MQTLPKGRLNLDGGTDQGRIVGFVDGVDSYSHPTMVKATQARWLENAVTKGALLQVRPGLMVRFQFSMAEGTPFRAWWDAAGNPPLHPQMLQPFKPTFGQWELVFAVSGSVWLAKINNDGSIQTPQLISADSFSPYADQLVGCPCVQTATVVSGVYSNNLLPQNLLMIQDGGNRSCSWNGTTWTSYNPGKLVTTDAGGNTLFPNGFNETIIGKWMMWSGNRLWVFNGPIGRASDLGDPTHFTEEMIQTSGGAWVFPQDVTGCIDRGTSGVTNSQGIVTTADTVWTLNTGVLNRIPSTYGAGWANTPNFQTKIFSAVGCVAGKSLIVHRGLLYWMSQDGLVVFDSTGTVFSSQHLPPIDQEMAYSRRLMCPDMRGVCAGSRDSYVFWGVPVGAVTGGRTYNGHLQVLDRQTTVVHTLGFNGPFTYGTIGWQGVWTGIRPVEWASCDIAGVIRPYALSMDQDGVIRIWEAFQGNRADNGHEIPWMLETRMHIAAPSLFETSIFRHVRLCLDQMLGNVGVSISWRGMRGIYKEIFSKMFTATPGSFFLQNSAYTPIKNDTENQSFTVQTRDVVTPDQRGVETCTASGVESPLQDAQDHAFSVLVKMTGRAAILGYRIAVDQAIDNTEGEGEIVNESGLNIVPENDCPSHVDQATPTYVFPMTFQREAFSTVVPTVPSTSLYQAPTT
jgi:hypothetical protein